jgi:AcrR family transcriptional regulator
LLDAALSLLLEREDPQRVSIDDVVQAVGATPPVVYYYFDSKDALVLAACHREYERFAQAMRAATADQADPVERLLSHAQAYLSWAVAHPVLYRLLFLTPLGGPTSYDPAQSTGLDHLMENLADARDQGRLQVADIDAAAITRWGVVHGFAALGVVHPHAPQGMLGAALAEAAGAVLASWA